MTENTLKGKTAKGLFWGGVSNGIQQLLQLVFGIFLARLLSPDDYGLVGMLTIFTLIASTLKESGFTAALTNKKDASDNDFNAVFWFSVIMGIGMYVILFFCAPMIARFFNQPRLTPLARFLFLGFVISSTSTAHYAYLFKHLMVKQRAIAQTTATLISGIVGVIMAWNGMAYWGIATQSLTYILVSTSLFWYFSSWRPSLHVSFAPLREMFGFSSRLLVTNIFTHINNNIFSVLLGKLFNVADVGYYTQANKWNNMGHSLISGMLTSVAQPVLSTLSDDKNYQLKALRKLLRFTAFVSFPAMLGLSLVAPELITIAITDKWLPSAQMMQLLCIGGAFLPISNLFSQLVLSRGHSSVYMWNTIVLSFVQLIVAILMYPYGIYRMLYAFVIIQVGWLLVWLYWVYKEINLTLWAGLKDISPYLILSIVLTLIVHHVTMGIESIGVRFMAKIIGVAVPYLFILWILRSVILRESIEFMFHRKR